MPDYRRHRVMGATYFFTVNLLDRKSHLLVERIELLRQVVARVRALMPFHVDAWVVLPNHMHCLWTLPHDDGNFPKRWQAIKMGFSRSVTPGEPMSASRRARGERGIWQRRYWEHTVRDERDYAAHMDYIHFNSVKHGFATTASEWEFSSSIAASDKGCIPPIGSEQPAGAANGESEGEWRVWWPEMVQCEEALHPTLATLADGLCAGGGIVGVGRKSPCAFRRQHTDATR